MIAVELVKTAIQSKEYRHQNGTNYSGNTYKNENKLPISYNFNQENLWGGSYSDFDEWKSLIPVSFELKSTVRYKKDIFQSQTCVSYFSLPNKFII